MKLFAKATLVVALLVMGQGCDLIEGVEPSTSISQEEALSNPDAVRGVRAKMYDRMHNTTQMNTDWLLGPSAQADDTYFRPGATRHDGLNLNEDRAGIGTGAWSNLYDMINDANILISGIEEGVLDEAVKSKFEAEAYFMRALAMHHGVRIFGYEPGMTPNSGPGAGFNLGIVIRTEPTLDVSAAVSKPRSTVSEVYDQIVSDLNEAINQFSQLPSNVREGSPIYASEASAQALLARVHLYQRNWSAAEAAAAEALELAGSQFGSGLASPSEIRNLSIFDETRANPEAIFTIDVDPATESGGVNQSLAVYTSMYWMAQIPTQDLINQYEPGDARLEAWYTPCIDDLDDAPIDCTAINDEDFELHKYAAEQEGDPYADDYIHLRVAEMVLIQAEARLNTSGVAAAIDRLNDLRAQRDASTLNPGNFTFDATYDAILDERRRELVAEGHRYFDLKRLGRDIQKAHGREDLPFESYRILDDLPQSQLEVDEELVQNPGYN